MSFIRAGLLNIHEDVPLLLFGEATILFPEIEVQKELEELYELSSTPMTEVDLLKVFKLLDSGFWPKITEEQEREWGHNMWWAAENHGNFMCNGSGAHGMYYSDCRTWAEQPVSQVTFRKSSTDR